MHIALEDHNVAIYLHSSLQCYFFSEVLAIVAYSDLRNLKFLSIIFKYSLHTSEDTRHISATKPNQLMLFRETIAVYCENHMNT
jgi:hypothetical protein